MGLLLDLWGGINIAGEGWELNEEKGKWKEAPDETEREGGGATQPVCFPVCSWAEPVFA